jgi:hypothetical protein
LPYQKILARNGIKLTIVAINGLVASRECACRPLMAQCELRQ